VTYLTATSGVTVNKTPWDSGQVGASGTVTGDASVGTDTFTGVQGVRGSEFADTFHGSNNPSGTVEVFQGRGGDDFIDGGAGFDRVLYSFRIDDNVTGGITVNMAAGTVDGDASVGHDTLRSIEAIRATDFADTYDATGFSNLSTNAGSNGTFNEFEGLGGNDTITGNGNTRIDYINATAGVTVDLVAGTATGDASVGTDTFTGVNAIQGSYFADTLLGSINGAGTTQSFDGGAGDDFIDGRGGFDLAYYNSAVGTLSGISVDMAAGTVIGDSSIGTDTLRSVELVRGTNFADTYDATGFSGSSTNAGSIGTFNEFEGLGGDDTITGNGNTRITYVSATAGVTVDLAAGTATGDASVGTDTFTGVSQARGSQFADTLSGNANNNTLDGRGGNDTLTGGAGADTFVYANTGGADVVTDFSHAEADKIDLTGVTGVTSLADVLAIATPTGPSGGDTVIAFGNGDTLTLNNVAKANLTASDFIFHV
jgi:Ca2+-binding RTX toxin-like protein